MPSSNMPSSPRVSAPSGANRQPWHFVVVTDAAKKAAIREAAEKEEREFYLRRASQEWLEALEPLGTDADKPFLTTAPVLIAIFLRRFNFDDDGNRLKKLLHPRSPSASRREC